MRKSIDVNSPIVGLRLNSIKVDYKTNISASTTSKTVKTAPCAVRVDIYNGLLLKILKFFISLYHIYQIERKICNIVHLLVRY